MEITKAVNVTAEVEIDGSKYSIYYLPALPKTEKIDALDLFKMIVQSWSVTENGESLEMTEMNILRFLRTEDGRRDFNKLIGMAVDIDNFTQLDYLRKNSESSSDGNVISTGHQRNGAMSVSGNDGVMSDVIIAQ